MAEVLHLARPEESRRDEKMGDVLDKVLAAAVKHKSPHLEQLRQAMPANKEKHMKQEIKVENKTDNDGNPAGGSIKGVGIEIKWQKGQLGRGEDRKEPNGAFVETVIQAAIARIEYYQSTKFNCWENKQAIGHLELALKQLEVRTAGREEREVEGTHGE